MVLFPSPSLDLAFDDEILKRVESVWEEVGGEGEFLRFEDREGVGEDED